MRGIDFHVHPCDERVVRAWAGDEADFERFFRGKLLREDLNVAAGAGTPGGRGQRLDYTRPIYLDHLAADFPALTIVAAHPSWPWTDEGLALARHKANVFLDLSGYSPKYIPPQYVQFANTLLQDQKSVV